MGPLPKDWAHYRGLYRHGRNIVLSYSVGTEDVLECPWSLVVNGQTFFVRTFHIGRTETPLTLYVADKSAGVQPIGVSLPANAIHEVAGNHYELNIGPLRVPTEFSVVLAQANHAIDAEAVKTACGQMDLR